MKASPADLDSILSPTTIRNRSNLLFDLTVQGKTHFNYHPEKLEEVSQYVLDVIMENYPDLNIPFHSRWGHFKVGGIDRLKVIDEKIKNLPKEEQARIKLDLVVVSVLLDAGAGEKWRFFEKSANAHFSRSEGLAVASLYMFLNGDFSDDPTQPWKVTAKGLEKLTREKLESGFQVTETNPLIGVEGRLTLLRTLGQTLAQNSTHFKNSRPGFIFDFIKSKGQVVDATVLLRAVLDGLGPIWPGRIELNGVNLGDVWSHSLLGTKNDFNSLVPFHKLSQWMTYSLIGPIEEAGVKIQNVHHMTGLPEYRNGGLFLDRGLLSLKNPEDLKLAHKPDSDLIIEWRALTVVLLDLVGGIVRKKLNKSEADFPLAKVLEGGTWWAGRKAAKEKRPDGTPPLKLDSDGTVF
jgi:hypothetical protein